MGLKPSYGRISRHGLVANASSFDQNGIIARSVYAGALTLEVIAGPEECESTVAQQPVPPYSQLSDKPDQKPKLAYLARYDGIRYGYRVQQVGSREKLYNKSQSIGFGKEVKRRIMLGTFVLSARYYQAYFTKA